MAKDVTALAALFATSGFLHLVRPEPFERIVPHRLPRQRALVYVSGAAELACAAGLLRPRTRRVAGWAAVGVLVGIFPANVQMAVDVRRSRSRALRVGSLLRLPLQAPMIRTAYRAARGRG